MLRLLLLAGMAAVLAAPTPAQTLDLVNTVTFPNSGFGTGGSDVWGYTAPDGTDYALYGVLTGIAVVQVPSMQVMGIVPGPEEADFYYHRDVVVHGSYAYAVSENLGVNEGLQVIDLSPLPDSVSLVNVYTDGVVSSHNLDADQGTGFLYVLDSGGGGVYIIDPSDPLNLESVHYLDLPRVHDVHARNDTLYVAEGSQPTFSIWDVANKTNPQLLARVTIPAAGYVHNIWPTDDGRYVLTTEETTDKTVKVWDITDLGNVQLVGEYLGPNRLAHNVHVQGGYAFISHYESGVVVLDLANPASPLEVARYDTHPQGEAPEFDGSWGATVPSPSGYVYSGDFDGTLTVLKFEVTPVASEPDAAPHAFGLEAAYPNPFREASTVRFTLDGPAEVRLSLHDALGREVGVLAEGPHAAGAHAVVLTPGALPAGLYLVRLDVAGRTETRRLTLLR